jgi:glycosyltransferase involved in cell wall biosynthesis
VASSNPEDLGRCVHELLEDPARREEMGRQGRQRVAELSWEQSTEVLLAAYEHAMALSTRPGDGSESLGELSRVPG